MYARTCVYKKDFVSLRAFCVYGRINQTYRCSDERERERRARGDCAVECLLGVQGEKYVHVVRESAKRDGRADVGADETR